MSSGREAVRVARGEGKAIMRAVRQRDGSRDVVGVARGLERHHNVESIVRCVGKPGAQPVVEAVSFSQWPLAARVGAPLMGVEMLAGRLAELPDAGHWPPLGVPELDCARGPVDKDAGVPEHQRNALQNDVGIADLARASPRSQSRMASDKRIRSSDRIVAGSGRGMTIVTAVCSLTSG
jgi:hypothetical protein